MKIRSFDEVGTLTHPATAANVSRRVSFQNLTQDNVNLPSEPARTCDNSLLVVSLVVFFTALFMVVVGEVLVPRLVSIVTLLVCAAAFYAGTLGTLYAAANACPGAQYLQTVDTVRNLIIACAAMLFIVALFDIFILYQRRNANEKRRLRAIIQYEDEDDPSLVQGAAGVAARQSIALSPIRP
jgi:hypothetical protein